MNILVVGDIVGSIGINKLKKELPDVKKEYNIDFTIVNGENAADGMGITEKNFHDIINAGADCITMGNHKWEKKEIFKFIDNLFNVFYNKKSCNIFGLVIREDLLDDKYKNQCVESFEINNKKSKHLTLGTKHNKKEYLYIFKK